MNPLTNMKNVLKLSENELKSESKTSWHDMYKGSAWIFVGGLPYDLTEGDIVCVFSQYGEIVNINLVRDKASGKSKGFCFICYEDQRSTILSVDNLNGIKILNRSLRVDHVSEYKVPKDNDEIDDETRHLRFEGCAPKPQIPIENIKREGFSSQSKMLHSCNEFHLPERLSIGKIKAEPGLLDEVKVKKENKSKKVKKSKKEKKSKKRKYRKNSNSESSSAELSGQSNNSSASKRKKQQHRSRSPSYEYEYKKSRRRSRS